MEKRETHRLTIYLQFFWVSGTHKKLQLLEDWWFFSFAKRVILRFKMYINSGEFSLSATWRDFLVLVWTMLPTFFFSESDVVGWGGRFADFPASYEIVYGGVENPSFVNHIWLTSRNCSMRLTHFSISFWPGKLTWQWKVKFWIRDTPSKTKMAPKNWWFVDVFPFPRGYFQVPC